MMVPEVHKWHILLFQTHCKVKRDVPSDKIINIFMDQKQTKNAN